MNQWPKFVTEKNYPGLKNVLNNIVEHVISLRDDKITIEQSPVVKDEHTPFVEYLISSEGDLPMDDPLRGRINVSRDPLDKDLRSIPSSYSEISELAREQAGDAEKLRIGNLRLIEAIPILTIKVRQTYNENGEETEESKERKERRTIEAYRILAKMRHVIGDYCQLMEDIHEANFAKDGQTIGLTISAIRTIAAEEMVYALEKAGLPVHRGTYKEYKAIFDDLLLNAGIETPTEEKLDDGIETPTEEKQFYKVLQKARQPYQPPKKAPKL